MSETYKGIGWNRQKIIYDAVLWIGIAVYIGVFVAVSAFLNPSATAETLLIRAFGTTAIILLHIVLIIGPLARLSSRFIPLLYNRRHLGVTTFIVALAHGALSTVQFHGFGELNPLVSILVSNTRFSSVPDFPFQVLGLLALLILLVMAASSHDFWLKNLTAPVWKTLHMLVYAAYFLVVGHVVLGVLQSETDVLLAATLGLGIFVIVSTHLAAAIKEQRLDSKIFEEKDEFVKICRVGDIPECKALIGNVAGERVAVFRYDGKVSAVSNVCQHQNGPLGEGKVIDGCITCPWHGFQYDPATGASPPPFTEKVPTFPVKIENDWVLVGKQPFEPGTFVKPAEIE